MYISADYEALFQNASALVNDASNYAALVQRIRAAMEACQESWQGRDSAAFVQKAQALQPQLLKMQEIIETHANALKQAANTYETVQAQRAAVTARLL